MNADPQTHRPPIECAPKLPRCIPESALGAPSTSVRRRLRLNRRRNVRRGSKGGDVTHSQRCVTLLACPWRKERVRSHNTLSCVAVLRCWIARSEDGAGWRSTRCGHCVGGGECAVSAARMEHGWLKLCDPACLWSRFWFGRG